MTVSNDVPIDVSLDSNTGIGEILQPVPTYTIPAPLVSIFQGRNINEITTDIIRAKAELYKKSFYEFVKEFIGDVMVEKAVFGKHIEYIAGELQKITYQVAYRRVNERDLIINICPGMTKSTLCSVLWPVWCWVVDPTISFITASHDHDLSNRFANKSRDLIKSDKFKLYFPHINLSPTQDNKGDYENKQGGYRLSTSSKAAPTGRHGLILLSDDIQNRDNADSEIERNNVNKWYTQTLSTRKSNKSASVMIIVQQRLHADDITGHLLDRNPEGYNVICLPAEISDKVLPKELKEIYRDGLLDPNRLSLEVIEKERKALGNRAFQTQYNQDPQSEEAAVLKTSMFPIMPIAEYQTLIKEKPPVIQFFCDTAYTAKTNRDPSAILACTKIGELLYILNISIQRLEFPALLRHIRSWTEANGYTSASKVTVEPKASGQSIVQMLKLESGLNIKEGISPKDSKETRLNAIANIVDSGRVILLQAQWNQTFLNEVTASTPRHDDIRDCMVNAIETILVNKKNSGRYCLSAASY